jgi:hypothetical protein
MRPVQLCRLVFLLVPIGACVSDEIGVQFEAVLDDQQPVPNLEIALLPFDPQKILHSLADSATTKPPSFASLERELMAYQPPDDEDLTEATAPWRALRDSLTFLADSLNTLSRGSPQYAQLFRRFRRTQPRLATLATQRDSAVNEVIAEHRALAARAQVAAESLRAWEDAAFRSYPALAEAALARSGREALTIQTDSSGRAHTELEPGDWWAIARHPDVANPFMEYSWTVRFTVTRWLPARVPLMRDNAHHQWRH